MAILSFVTLVWLLPSEDYFVLHLSLFLSLSVYWCNLLCINNTRHGGMCNIKTFNAVVLMLLLCNQIVILEKKRLPFERVSLVVASCSLLGIPFKSFGEGVGGLETLKKLLLGP
jgi:hypothetical protein